MRKKIGGVLLVISLLLVGASPGFAEDPFGDFFDSADEEFLKLKKEADDEFAELSKLDTEFADILNRAWKELELSTGIQPDTVPKPERIPVAQPADTPEEPAPIAPSDTTAVPDTAEEPEPSVRPTRDETLEPTQERKIIQKEITVPTQNGIPLNFEFIDTPVEFFLDPNTKVLLNDDISEKVISSYWEEMAGTDYTPLLEQCSAMKAELALNDWGYCLLLDRFSGALYGAAKPERPLFIWFLLVKSGFDARVGYSGEKVFVLIPSDQIVYNVPFYELDGERYYLTWLGVDGGEVKSLYTNEKNYADAVRKVDYALSRTPDLTKHFNDSSYGFEYSGKTYGISLALDMNKIRFYERYPQTNLDVYFSAPITVETSRSLLDGVQSCVDGLPEDEAVNVILRFVQTAFAYKTDGDQFGYEKYMFPEETLYYPFSDCEDRSFLFAYLVRNILGLEVIGLDYPGHIATAVRFTGNAGGDSVTYGGATYTICDPTYINATYGMCMPQFKDVNPDIIPIPSL